MADTLPQLAGLSPVDCPVYVKRPCYTECEHLTTVLRDYYNYENYSNSPRHLALTESLLQRQDELIQAMCAFSLDTCTQGLLRGFPCIQCGYVCQRGFSLCVGDVLTCGPGEYMIINPHYTCNSPVCNDQVICEIDFTSTPELVELYGRIVAALQLTVNANISGITAVIQTIFDSGAQVVNYIKNTFYIWLGQDATDEQIRLWPIITRALPLPLGTTATLINQI